MPPSFENAPIGIAHLVENAQCLIPVQLEKFFCIYLQKGVGTIKDTPPEFSIEQGVI